jgi:NlpC/P60 family
MKTMLTRVMLHALITACVLAGTGFGVTAAASAATAPARLTAYGWALSQAGKPYIWGATGPYGYDCSGLVMEAYEHAGIDLPRTTYEMLASPLLVPTTHPQRGDLAFYGPGHVELYDGGDTTFGAHETGQPIGPVQFGAGWAPTAFYYVKLHRKPPAAKSPGHEPAGAFFCLRLKAKTRPEPR